MADSKNAERVQVLIIGAGLGGISAGLTLKKQLGCEDFMICEKASAVGGTWRDNTYPGCGSDNPAHWYSLSTEPNPNWTSYYVSQPEIRAYWQGIWDRYHLDVHTKFNTEVVLAAWDDDAQVYHVTLEDVIEKRQRVVDAKVVWWAAGGFHAPFFPEDVKGVKEFKGEVWHSARWRHDVDLKGKRVGVIGNGCSGAQLIPPISEDPSVQVTNFVRSPQWYVPRLRFNYKPWQKWVFAHVPLAMKLYRALIVGEADLSWLAFKDTESFGHRIAVKNMTAYIKRKAPEAYHDALVPKYPPGCKRVIVDPSYLSSLHRPNVDLNWTTIDCVVEDGLKLTTGEVVPLDVIIFATGFGLLPPRLVIKGRKGQTLKEYYESVGGPLAYLGMTVPDFPNFFMCLGPNTAGGHASVIFNEEVQINHALQLMKPLLEGKVQSFAVREEVCAKYNAWLQNRLARSVWNFCQSYYRGRSSDERNFETFPGPVMLFWWLGRKAKFEEYEMVGGERFARERRVKKWVRWVAISAVLAGVVSGRCTSLQSVWKTMVDWQE
ncbi:FAD/NAD-binding domain-containing protein [Amylostereum chailletii]|nr:FAD/NAD-binding domain-containing protein [Amylostereum chailletii]